MLGVIGGVGPWATQELCRMVNSEVRADGRGRGADLHVANLPIDLAVEQRVLTGRQSPADEQHLVAGLSRCLGALERIGCDAVAMPCNSLQPYLDAALRQVPLPNISPAAAAVRRRGFEEVLLISTRTTLQMRLYHDQLPAVRVRECPEELARSMVDYSVRGGEDDAGVLGSDAETIARLARAVAEQMEGRPGAVLLGCTDLGMFLEPLQALGVPVIDSLTEQTGACAEFAR
ncbi:aspartate/glutamate racemase family protein [Rothia kristinae]